MPDKDPIEKFLDEVARTLELTEQGKKKMLENKEKGIDEPIPADIQKKLENAKQAVEWFLKLNSAFIPTGEEHFAEIQKAIENPEKLPESGRQIIEQSKKLQKDVELIRNDINAALLLDRLENPVTQQEIKTKEEDRTRRKKFRGIKDRDKKI